MIGRSSDVPDWSSLLLSSSPLLGRSEASLLRSVKNGLPDRGDVVIGLSAELIAWCIMSSIIWIGSNNDLCGGRSIDGLGGALNSRSPLAAAVIVGDPSSTSPRLGGPRDASSSPNMW